jgi:hypothetical protein
MIIGSINRLDLCGKSDIAIHPSVAPRFGIFEGIRKVLKVWEEDVR